MKSSCSRQFLSDVHILHTSLKQVVTARHISLEIALNTRDAGLQARGAFEVFLNIYLFLISFNVDFESQITLTSSLC